MLYAVILAGGSGTRLWPSSRRNMPKQAIPLIEGKSLFQLALTRVEGWVPPERTFVITNAAQADILAAQAPRIPRSNIIGEPLARDSAAAIFLAAAITGAGDPDALNLVMPADHLLSPVERFRECARGALRLAEKGMLTTFGVKPRYPATGYGYIERGEPLPDVPGAYRVVRFKEKPDEATAGGYIASGRFYWNSGMFAWRARAILDAARVFAREHHDAVAPLAERFGADGFSDALRAAYEPLRKVSIDYAVMEKAPNIAVVEADFDWSDVGSHTAMRDFTACDADGNIRIGSVEAVDSANCVVASSDGHLVAIFGCKDMVVVHTADATLVVPADRAQDLKKLISRLENKEDLQKYL
jgi:mannose-1-phosphate guanylyltransferase